MPVREAREPRAAVEARWTRSVAATPTPLERKAGRMPSEEVKEKGLPSRMPA
jgi:hypothetical protein